MNLHVIAVLIFALLESVSGRLRGITTLTANVASDASGTGFPSVQLNQPSGNPPPPVVTTPSPYQTYSATWPLSMTFQWNVDPTAFAFDTSNIANLKPDNLGPNFQVLRTAGLTYIG